MNQNDKYTFEIDIIKDTINKLADIVLPSMGAKGKMALIERGGFDKPLITDDGVTIAKESRTVFDINERPIYNLCIEAMHNVEKEAADGTTLAILMLKELYKEALKKAEETDVQTASIYIQDLALEIIKELDKSKLTEINHSIIKSIATVSTKMPLIGSMISDAWKIAGDEMNIIIEHDRTGDYQHKITREPGFSLENCGWNMDEFVSLTNDENNTKTEFENARLMFLSSGGLETKFAINFFNSFPTNKEIPPIVFFIPKHFAPLDLLYIINTLNNTNKSFLERGSKPVQFQFVVMSNAGTDRMFQDVAAFTGGKIQDATLGTREYLFENSGYAKFISITRHQTIIIPDEKIDNKLAVENRIKQYEEYLESNKFSINEVDTVDIKKQLSALTSGIIKIKLSLPTRSNFDFIKLKLDDAIGTVKHVCRNGYILGGGKALYNLNHIDFGFRDAPLKQILSNAEAKDVDFFAMTQDTIYNVVTKEYEPADKNGIYDSFEAYKRALLQASSVVAQLILSYVYITKK